MALEQAQGLSLQQALSPQMQQSLHVLQAPVAELRQLVNAELERNPAIEEVEPAPVEAPRPDGRTGLDDEWREYYAQRAVAEPWTAEAEERRQHFLDSMTRPPTLAEHLRGQLDLSMWSRGRQEAAEIILGSLDEGGYFRGRLEEAAYPVGLTVAEAEEVLGAIQALDPPGVAARDLKECLLLQLARLDVPQPLAGEIAKFHLDALARRKLPEIAKALRVGLPEVRQAAEVIRTLDPRPGRPFADADNPVVVADVFIERNDEGVFHVRLNDEALPRLRLANDFKDLLSVAGTEREAREFLRERLRAGKFFLSCIDQRNQTLLAIARVILARQHDFFERGPAGLKPMTMSQVAAEVGVHETTVSRAVSGKYAGTPQGLFELKHFFRTGFATGGGEAVSNESVRQEIAGMVRGENPSHPLSDQDIVDALSARGLRIARRTVAKYRDQLGLLPSHLRRP